METTRSARPQAASRGAATILRTAAIPLILALTILTITSECATSAPRCHIYRVWRYPKPQRCFIALAYVTEITKRRAEQIAPRVPRQSILRFVNRPCAAVADAGEH